MNSHVVLLNLKTKIENAKKQTKVKQLQIKQQNLSFVQIYSFSGVLLKYVNGVKAAFAMK